MFKEETGDQFFNNVKLFFKKLYSRTNGIFKAKWNPQLPSYCETPQTVNTRNIYGMLLCCEKLASKAQITKPQTAIVIISLWFCG